MFKINPLLTAVLILAATPFAVQAAPNISDGGFDSGELGSWSFYTVNANSTLGNPKVLEFETIGGIGSNALRLEVGSLTYDSTNAGGGGIFQGFFAQTKSQYLISADIAAYGIPPYTVFISGTFSLLVDNKVVDSFTSGTLGPEDIARSSLNFDGMLDAGTHEIRIEVVRHATYAFAVTPYQYIDNITLSAVPEPTSSALMTIGLIALASRRTRSSSNAA